MNYSIAKYKGQWAVFCAKSRCFVLFGTKKNMLKRCAELNPVAWKDCDKECFECGNDFKPESKYQRVCEDCSNDDFFDDLNVVNDDE